MSIHFVARTRNVDCRRKLHEWGLSLAVMHVSRGLMKQCGVEISGQSPWSFPIFLFMRDVPPCDGALYRYKFITRPFLRLLYARLHGVYALRSLTPLFNIALYHRLIQIGPSVGSAYRQRYFDPGCGPRSMLVPVIRQ